jgi:hypothetical protein
MFLLLPVHIIVVDSTQDAGDALGWKKVTEINWCKSWWYFIQD